VPYDFSQQVLRTDAAGMPLDWVTYQEAVRCYHLGQVLYSCGNELYTVHGGICAATGKQSKLVINSIIATEGQVQSKYHHKPNYTPPLSNKCVCIVATVFIAVTYRETMLRRSAKAAWILGIT